jgi:hypothetical protein
MVDRERKAPQRNDQGQWRERHEERSRDTLRSQKAAAASGAVYDKGSGEYHSKKNSPAEAAKKRFSNGWSRTPPKAKAEVDRRKTTETHTERAGPPRFLQGFIPKHMAMGRIPSGKTQVKAARNADKSLSYVDRIFRDVI